MFSLLRVITITSIASVMADMCSIASQDKYSKYNTPETDIMAKQPLAYWYTDRSGTLESAKQDLSSFITRCGDSTPVVVVYGIPGKDCSAKESQSGFNTPETYETFIRNLVETITPSTLVILEPDAVALSIDNCGAGVYPKYLSMALSAIPNAYLDVGHWVSPEKVKQLGLKSKGFSLNLSNYRSNTEMASLCSKLISPGQKCLIDTSRNHNGASVQGTWCNYKGAGIGKAGPGDGDVEAYIWIKPAIELDGNCYGNQDSYTSNLGAGSPDLEWFKILWNQGYYASMPIMSRSPQPTQYSEPPQPTQPTEPEPTEPTQHSEPPMYRCTSQPKPVEQRFRICLARNEIIKRTLLRSS